MQKVLTFHQTTIGKKALMALTGLVLVGFVLGHLAGNLQLYLGPVALNEYAALLHSMPGLLWGARITLIVAVVLHILTAIQLAQRNSAARPPSQRYKKKKSQVTTYAARTMYWSGPILLLFIAYHLAHLTFGYAPGYEFSETNIYNNIVYGFMNPITSLVYIAGNLALAFHLYHGIWSMFQSLGASHPRYDKAKRTVARTIGLCVALGNISFPIAVMTGIVGPDDGSLDTEEAAIEVTSTQDLAPPFVLQNGDVFTNLTFTS